jgi:GTPase SAR1 family protein
MPLYGQMPEHFGEKLFAESLISIDDGRMHLFFDVMLPGVSNIDVVLWDEIEGVFCLEVKAVPIEMIEEISVSEVVIQGRGRGRSPMTQARKGTFDLLTFLRKNYENVPWLTSTVAWSKINRNDWESHWDSSELPKNYARSMVFADDLVTLEAFRERLRYLRTNAPWGSTEPKPFKHGAQELDQFVSSIMGRALRDNESSQSYDEVFLAEIINDENGNHGNTRNARSRIVLDTDSVRDSARSLMVLIDDAWTDGSSEWAVGVQERIKEITNRLDRPFKLGIVGEMKAGKSSVLNGLLGIEVALTDALECTFCPQRVAFGDVELARIHSVDGVKEVEIEALIDELRTVLDESGHAGISSVECFLPAGILENIEIWDSPGFGGSDNTNHIAEHFIESVDAAIWVFNKDYMGQRQLDEILSGLQLRGKSIIGVVNKCENMSLQEFDQLTEYLKRAYPGIHFNVLLPFSAKLALSPNTDEDRAELATDNSGNITLLLETIRTQIVSNPGRLSARAASGDLRAICFSVRDDIQKELLDEKRKLFLYKNQLAKSSELLSRRFAKLGETFGAQAISAIRQSLTDEGQKQLQRMAKPTLRNPELFKRSMQKCVNGERIKELLDKFFEENLNQIAEAVRAAGVDLFEDYKTRITEFERLGQSHWDIRVDVNAEALEPNLQVNGKAASVAVFTGSALGAVALAIPGPQWPFVAVGVVVSYLASKSLLKNRDGLSDSDLHTIRQNEWAKAINEFLDHIGTEIKCSIDKVLDNILIEANDVLRQQIFVTVLGSKSVEERTSELSKLEALRQGAEMLIEQLGISGLALPSRSVVTSGVHSIEQGNKSEAQLLIKKIISSSREMLAITDGDFGFNSFPLFWDAKDEVAIRILAWQQPTSSLGEAFRISLAEFRAKRSGTVHVVAPVPVTHNVDQLPMETWLFVSGWAYKINVSLLDAWTAKQDFQIESIEDDGSIYMKQFGRWFDDNVPGYQGIQV